MISAHKNARRAIIAISIFIIIIINSSMALPYFAEPIWVYVLFSSIYVSTFIIWTISIYKRIMQKQIRFFLLCIGTASAFWIAIRVIKWDGFEFFPLGDRIMWYLFYLPEIFLPLMFLFAALSINKGENYKMNKKLYLLFIPATVLLTLVLTNDFHQLVFEIPDLSIIEKGQSYTYGLIYYLIWVFMIGLITATVIVIVKNFRNSAKNKKIPILPFCFIIMLVIYSIFYQLVFMSFVDVTLFSCLMVMGFWESCIYLKLIHSNTSHEKFFRLSDLGAEILTKDGQSVYKSNNSSDISEDDLAKLKENSTISLNDNMLVHLSEINNGYILWNSDVSQVNSLIFELETLNESLLLEVNLLEHERKMKETAVKLEKYQALNKMLTNEILHHSKKVELYAKNCKNMSEDERKKALFDISVVLVYIKRKMNMIVVSQTQRNIDIEEFTFAFEETFRTLRMADISCGKSVNEIFTLSCDWCLIAYDLFQIVVEKYKNEINSLYVSFNVMKNIIHFTIQLDNNYPIDGDEFEGFKNEFVSEDGGDLNIINESESNYIRLRIPR